MTTTEIIGIILSSSILTALLTGLITWKIKQSEFKETVFVNFIKRRIDAYEQLEDLLGTLSIVYRDSDGKKYHSVFRNVGPFQQFFLDLAMALKFNTWYSPEIIDILRKINDLQETMGGLKFNDNEDEIIENAGLGKLNYERICNLKDELLAQIREDYKNIHNTDFSKFFGETKH